MIYNNYRFTVPEEKMIRVITDTDAKNEADDQFAIVQTLLSPRFDNVGFIAAHFGNNRIEKSMEASYGELETIFSKMSFPTRGMLFHGAPHGLPDISTPVESEGARLIIEQAMKDDPRPLYITFMGPLTDLASAYLMEPRISKRLTAIWIGGGAYPSGGQEFNLGNDIHAANVIFAGQIPLWQVPKNVYEMMPVSLAELEAKLYDKGAIGKYLLDQLVSHSQEAGPRKSDFRTGETWVLGDNPSVGLLLYEHRFEFDWLPAPVISAEMLYTHTGRSRPIRVYKKIDSRLILEDMFAKVALFHRNYPDGWAQDRTVRV
jgi:hypothetical protein